MNTDDGGMWISWKREMSSFLSTGSCPQSRWAAQVTRQNRSSCQTFTAGFFSFCPPLTFSGSLDCLLPASLPPSLSPLSPHTLHLHILCLPQKTETINQQSFSVSLHNGVLSSDKTQCSNFPTARLLEALSRLQKNSQVREEPHWSSSGCKIQFYISETISQRWVFFPFLRCYIYIYFFRASCVTVCSIRGCITHFIRGCVRHERCWNSWLIPKRPKVQHYLEELAG